jgi:V-type H+-transporting ATPase subunit e
MGALAWIFWTFVWGTVGIGLRSFVPMGPNQGIIQTGLSLSAACCYILWLCAYMAQMNPLFGPQLNNITLTLMSKNK